VKWFAETALIAIRSLRANKLRTFLTTLGVIIGIGTIIGMLSLINGINETVVTEFRRLGPDVFYLTRYEPGIHVGTGREERKEITPQEVRALGDRCASIGRISIVGSRRGQVRFRGRKSGVVSVIGVAADYVRIAGLSLEDGRFFGDSEAQRLRVCIMGSGVAEALMGKTSPVGKDIDINGRRFRVLGELEESGVTLGTGYDDAVIIPYRWCRMLFGESAEDYAMALPAEGVDVKEAIEHARRTVRAIRKIRLGEEDDFAISSQETLLETYKKLTGRIYWVMRIIASVALVVSGIGITNIMIVAVMERTREVGLRKAVGASRAAIAGQFLVEAVILTVMGGVAGIGLGLLIRWIVNAGTGLPASVPVWAVPLSLGICCGIGLFSGLYPALRASGLDPVRALRYE
jgi:putative ABC transport system permease protein